MLSEDEISQYSLHDSSFLLFVQTNRFFRVSHAVNCPDFAATVTALFCLPTYAG